MIENIFTLFDFNIEIISISKRRRRYQYYRFYFDRSKLEVSTENVINHDLIFLHEHGACVYMNDKFIVVYS